MAGMLEISHSLRLVSKAKQRLVYQKQVIANLGFDGDARRSDVARDIQAVMQAKVDMLELRHAKLVRSLD